MSGPLNGIRVLDLSQGHGGPYCTMRLGDAGADVIKVESPDGDWSRLLGPPFIDRQSTYFMALNRNKRSISLDMKTSDGLEIAKNLARHSDVVVENYRPGVAESLGIDYEAVREFNPNVVYCAISAYDSQGPHTNLPGTELSLQARAGVMRTLGRSGAPAVRFGEDVVCAVTGNYAAQAVVAALFHRVRSDEGQLVRVSMLRSMMHLNSYVFTFDCSPDDGLDDPRNETTEPNAGYMTNDLPIGFSFPFMLAGYPADQRWRTFCERIGLERIVDDPRFATRFDRQRNSVALRACYEEAFSNRTSAEITEILEQLGALNAVYNDFATLLSHPQILANGLIWEFEHTNAGVIRTVGSPSVLSETPYELYRPPPEVGEHSREILRECLGVSDRQFEVMRLQGAVT